MEEKEEEEKEEEEEQLRRVLDLDSVAHFAHCDSRNLRETRVLQVQQN